MNTDELARAFSGHAFEQTFDHLAADVVWNLVGQTQLVGRDAVVAACRATTAETQNVTTTWLRFVSTGEGDVVAVDAVGRYEGSDGLTAVSSCDIYEFTGRTITTITSYATEVDPDQPYPPTAAVVRPEPVPSLAGEVRRRVQQQTRGHRGRKADPLYRIRNILRAGHENLTDRTPWRGPPDWTVTLDPASRPAPGWAVVDSPWDLNGSGVSDAGNSSDAGTQSDEAPTGG